MPNRFDSDYSVDAKKEDVGFVKDMSPATLMDEILGDGFINTTKPEGDGTPKADVTVGGRGTADYVAAQSLRKGK